MKDKLQLYTANADYTAGHLTDSWQQWTAFLATASRLYKYSYYDQLMIFSQRPKATAYAESSIWNDVMRRYVRRGSKGIALLDTSGEKPRLRYVFDISDTGEYGKIPAVHFFGNFRRNMKRRWLKFWSRDLACLWKIIWLSSSRVLQTSLSVSIGRNTSGIFVTSLTEGYQEGEDRKNLHTSGGRSRPNI